MMRHQRWEIDGYDYGDATTWTATAMTALTTVVRWLIMFLGDHLVG
ncbi:hypothetical protein ACIA5D_26980 [Actinoplanes sp. NPDC051513]